MTIGFVGSPTAVVATPSSDELSPLSSVSQCAFVPGTSPASEASAGEYAIILMCIVHV